MSRYTQSFISPFPPQQVYQNFAAYLTSNGFKQVTKNGESYWKKGVGLLAAPQFLKLTQANGVFVLEAWIRMAILPGVYLGEMSVDGGFVGCIPKSMLKSTVEQILVMLQAQSMQGAYNFNPNMPSPGYIPPQGNMNMPPQGYMPQQGNMNIPSQGYMPQQGNMNMPSQGYIPQQGNINIQQQSVQNIPAHNNQAENNQPVKP